MTRQSDDGAGIGEDDSPALRTRVDAALRAHADQVGRLLGRPVDAIVPSPKASAYRARVLLRPNREGVLGFTRPGTHNHVPCAHAPLAMPALNAVLASLPALPGLGAVELRTAGDRVVVAGWSPRRGKGARNRHNRGVPPAVRDQLRAIGPQVQGVALDGKTIAGDTVLHPIVSDVRLHIGPASFFQVNPEVNAALVRAVIDACEGAKQVVDLYAGVGNLGLPIAKATGAAVKLIESHPQAAADARKAARANGISADVQTSDADAFRAGDAFFDVAVLDPPRVGAPGVLAQLAITRPRRIIYVSCNPTALARDLRAMRSAGYAPEHTTVFDMFPQTDHVETMCILGRNT
jgi:23S rRNA (uracil1939-C5)-methyltransferase